MKQKITIAILGILMIASVMATYSGESETITLPEEFEYYSIVGNSTPIILNITTNGLNVTITFDKYQQEDNFELIFFNKEKEIITKTVHTYSGGGGGGSSTRYVDRNVTVFEPKFYDRNITDTETITITETEEKVIYQETGYNTWMLVFAMVLGIIFGWLITRNPKVNDTFDAEEEIEKLNNGEDNNGEVV